MTARKLVAEFLGTAFLLVAIVGSGISASVDGAASAQLFQHAVVVGVALTALILTFGPISGAHFNPAVTAADAALGGTPWRLAAAYVAAQISGAAVGVVSTHIMFDLPATAVATTTRTGAPLVASEAIATGGLLLVIYGIVRAGNISAVPGAVGAYITAAIYFTSSASFANPAVTLARGLTDTWTGIAPPGIPAFLAGQIAGVVGAVGIIGWLFNHDRVATGDVVLPHDHAEDNR